MCSASYIEDETLKFVRLLTMLNAQQPEDEGAFAFLLCKLSILQSKQSFWFHKAVQLTTYDQVYGNLD